MSGPVVTLQAVADSCQWGGMVMDGDGWKQNGFLFLGETPVCQITVRWPVAAGPMAPVVCHTQPAHRGERD